MMVVSIFYTQISSVKTLYTDLRKIYFYDIMIKVSPSRSQEIGLRQQFSRLPISLLLKIHETIKNTF